MFEFPQKNRQSIFLKEILTVDFLKEILFKIPFWREIDNVTSYFSISKIWGENSISIPIDSGITNFEYDCLVGLNIKEGRR